MREGQADDFGLALLLADHGGADVVDGRGSNPKGAKHGSRDLPKRVTEFGAAAQEPSGGVRAGLHGEHQGGVLRCSSRSNAT